VPESELALSFEEEELHAAASPTAPAQVWVTTAQRTIDFMLLDSVLSAYGPAVAERTLA
jgi:hypothetical protein